MKRKAGSYWMILAAVLLAGVWLRVSAMWGSQYTHDELSALMRIGPHVGEHYSFGDLIRLGVLPDGHPAGVQVLLWLWTMLAGYDEWAVRLPFLLAGIACMPMAYVVGRQWWGRNAGLLAAVFVALSHYTIYYSGIARPYVVGLLLILCLICFWDRVVLSADGRWCNVLLMALTAALCAYTHYFAMLTAGLLMLCGLLICDRGVRKRYVAGCVAAVLLWLPHAGITIHQLTQIGGLAWLGRPTGMFLPRYVMYLCHFSWLLLTVVALTLADMGIRRADGHRMSRKTLGRTLLAWLLWLLPIAIGYGYSVWRSPVLQYSCLIFSYPFLLLALGGLVREGWSKSRGWDMAFLAAMFLLTYFDDRQPGNLKGQPFATAYQELEYLADNGDDVAFYSGMGDAQRDYYIERHKGSKAAALMAADLHGKAADLRTDYERMKAQWKPGGCLVATELDLYQLEVARALYPEAERIAYTVRSTVYRLVAKGAPVWPMTDSTACDPEAEFTPLLECRLDSLISHRSDILRVYVGYTTDSDSYVEDKAPRLVIETLRQGRQVDWQCVPLTMMPFEGVGFAARCFDEVVKNDRFLDLYRVKVYVWNPDRDRSVKPYAYHCRVDHGNRYRLGVEERVK